MTEGETPPPTPPPEPVNAEAPPEPPKDAPSDPPEPATPPTDTPEPPADPEKSQIDIAKELVDEMKKQNEVMTANLKKAEKLSAEQLLGGTIPAGKEKTQDDLEVEAAKKLLEGTGFAELLFPEKKE